MCLHRRVVRVFSHYYTSVVHVHIIILEQRIAICTDPGDEVTCTVVKYILNSYASVQQGAHQLYHKVWSIEP